MDDQAMAYILRNVYAEKDIDRSDRAMILFMVLFCLSLIGNISLSVKLIDARREVSTCQGR